ncbi:hypothetical protein [Nocardioides aurantiacus]|uniref:hypothetical protein n=1 Tax=Nocardioides aurantiacus TaxID=86796 RepID=UPI00403F69A2
MIDQPRTGIGDLPFASMGDLGLDKKRVTQCALSRICGVCAQSLDRPVAFVGSGEELARNAFHFPPTHRACAEHALTHWAPTWSASLGHSSPPESWVLVTTSGFEFVRQNADAVDRRPVFSPNSILEQVETPALRST